LPYIYIYIYIYIVCFVCFYGSSKCRGKDVDTNIVHFLRQLPERAHRLTRWLRPPYSTLRPNILTFIPGRPKDLETLRNKETYPGPAHTSKCLEVLVKCNKKKLKAQLCTLPILLPCEVTADSRASTCEWPFLRASFSNRLPRSSSRRNSWSDMRAHFCRTNVWQAPRLLSVRCAIKRSLVLKFVPHDGHTATSPT